MSYTKKQWIDAATKLIELTSKGKMKWDITNEYEEDALVVVDRAFAAQSEKFRYLVKNQRHKHFIDEEAFYWDYSHGFEIYKKDFDGYTLIATAPQLQIISTLFAMVEANFAVQQGALDELLDGEWEEDE